MPKNTALCKKTTIFGCGRAKNVAPTDAAPNKNFSRPKRRPPLTAYIGRASYIFPKLALIHSTMISMFEKYTLGTIIEMILFHLYLRD
jgi:hypothetical protein